MCEELIKNGQGWKPENVLYAATVIHEKTVVVMMEERSEDGGGLPRRKNQ